MSKFQTLKASSLEQESSPVVLVGSPNAGKTTLFNWLTGSKFKTVNYPGSTVEYFTAQLDPKWGPPIKFVDTPGTYSLNPRGEDEEVTNKVLFEKTSLGNIQHVVLVMDATQLERQILLAKQLADSGFNLIIALTMVDLIKRSGQKIKPEILSSYLGCPVIKVDGGTAEGVEDLVKVIENAIANTSVFTSTHQKAIWSRDQIYSIQNEIQKIMLLTFEMNSGITKAQANEKLIATTKKIDKWLLHSWAGPLVFCTIMVGLFSSLFWLAAPLMEWIDHLFGSATAIAQGFTYPFASSALIGHFIGKGLIGSLGSVMVFLPQIFILFVGITLLESTGYLSRAAVLIDRPLSKLGMSGRSFVPLLSGFACAVPAIMATRNMSSRRDRWITAFIIPLLPCSARIPVYSLLIGFLFTPAWAGVAMATVYFGSLVVGAIAAKILDRLIKQGQKSHLLMEMPLYRKPKFRVVLRQAWSRTLNYLKRAGPPIFAFALLMWVGTTFPNYKASNDAEKLSSSYIGMLGEKIQPVFTPMGVDWRVGVGLISAFAAREVFVSSMGVMFNLTELEDSESEKIEKSLLGEMRNAKNLTTGLPLFTIGSVLGLLVFFMIALQCTSTVAIAAKEMGSFKFAATQLIGFNLVAYLLAISIYQFFRISGLG